jgi:hypothetical protein
MIYTWFTGINYYKLAVEKDRIFTTITTIWKPGSTLSTFNNVFSNFHMINYNLFLFYRVAGTSF